MCITSTRMARVCLAEAIEYAKVRKTFGKPLVKHQVIRHKLMEMARQIEANYAWIENITYSMTLSPNNHDDLAGIVALCKVQSTKLYEFCAREASQVFGGNSFTVGGVGGKVERLYREVRVQAIGGGSEEILLVSSFVVVFVVVVVVLSILLLVVLSILLLLARSSVFP